MAECPSCYGRGEIYDGKEIVYGMGGSFERSKFRTCPTCEGTGRDYAQQTADAAAGSVERRLTEKIGTLENRIERLERIIEVIRRMVPVDLE